MKKLFIILLLIAAGITGLLFISKQWVNNVKKEDILETFSKLITDGSDSLYSVEIGNYEITGPFTGARIDNVVLRINQDVFLKMRAENTLPDIIMDGKVKSLVLEGVDMIQLVGKNKDIRVRNIVLSGTEFNLYHYKKTKKDTSATTILTSLYDRIKKDFNSIHVGEISILDGKMSYDPAGKLDKSNPFWKFDKIDIVLRDILVDSASVYDTNRFLYARDFTSSISRFRGIMGNDLYTFGMDTCNYDFRSASLDISGLRLSPHVSHEIFFRSKKFAVGESTIELPSLKVFGFYAGQAILDGRISVDSVMIERGRFEIYKDKSFGDPPVSKNGQYPNQLFLKLHASIHIPLIRIRNSSVVYTEKGLKTKKEGKIVFSNIYGSLSNITNIDSMIRRNPWSELTARAVFLGKSPMDARIALKLGDRSGTYEADATLRNLNAPQINPVLRGLAQAEAATFSLHNLSYKSRGNTRAATGSMKMNYSALNIRLLTRDEETNKLEEKKWLSLLANAVKIRQENLHGPDEIKADNIVTRRPYFRGFFALIWFNIFDCMTEITIKGDQPAILTKNRKAENLIKANQEHK